MTSLDTTEPTTETDGAMPVDNDNKKDPVAECEAAIQKVLKEHDCAIVPYLTGEPVGNAGTKVLMVAMWGVVPGVAT